MKKLLAITLVLGLAATANAVPKVNQSGLIEVPVGTTVDIVLTSDGDGYAGYFEISDEAAITGAVMSGDAGSLADLQDPATVGWGGTWFFVAAGVPGALPVADAAHFTFTYTALDETTLNTVTIYADDWATPLLEGFQLQNIPEPMTLGLLGLGGLFLRRRK